MDKEKKSFYEHYLIIATFLGGITFTAMVLMIESNDKLVFVLPFNIQSLLPSEIIEEFSYSGLLISIAGLTSIFFIVSTVGSLKIINEKIEPEKKFSVFISRITDIGFILLVVILIPFTISSFSALAASVIVILSIILVVILYISK